MCRKPTPAADTQLLELSAVHALMATSNGSLFFRISDCWYESCPRHWLWLRVQGDSPMDRRTFFHVAAGFSLSPMSGVFSASAQAAWPSHSMTIIVPFAPGGQADLPARPVALGLAKILGQSV